MALAVNTVMMVALERSVLLPVDIEALKHDKYYAETYPLGIDFTNRLRTGQSVTGVTATITDVAGVDCSVNMLGTTAFTATQASVVLKANAGTKGQVYQLKFVVTTTNDTIEQLVYLTLK